MASSPHFGGLWEAGVKSVKTHLKKIAGNASLTYKELLTLLIQIEAVLNSRPLCPISNDPNNYTALTPGHFIIGESILSPNEPQYLLKPNHVLKRWQYVQKLKQQIVNEYKEEYLKRLVNRPKWKQVEKSIKLHDLVLLTEDQLPDTEWPVGRVIEIHAGKDNLVRFVSVKTNDHKVFKRPITKLRILQVNCTNNYDEN